MLAAVAAALAINAGYVLQHRGLVTTPRVELRRPVAAVAALVRCRRWLAGAALGYAGLGLELVALTTLRLSTVQATIAAGLVVVAVLGRGAPAGPAAPAGALLAVAALAALAAVTPRPPAVLPAPAPWALAAAIGLIAAAAVATAAARRTPAGLAVAAGLWYGATSLAVAALAPVLAGAPRPPAVVAVALAGGAPVTAAGFLCFQRALQGGRPLAVVTAMMAAMSSAAIAGGLVVLGDPLAPGPAARAVQLTALAVAGLSALVVLRGEPAAAQELPGLLRGRDPERRPGVRRPGPGPGVPPADQPQMGHDRAAATALPLQAHHVD
jgi:hypothetical protein